MKSRILFVLGIITHIVPDAALRIGVRERIITSDEQGICCFVSQ